MKVLSSSLIILFVILFPAATSSQSPTQQPKTGADDVVKISTTLIQVDATVLDKKGKPVKGLTADDFEIYENSKKQPITNFAFVELETDKSTEPFVTRRVPNAVAAPLGPSRLRPEQVHRTVALVVDDLGLSVPSIDVVKSSLKKFVDEQMQPGDVVAIIRTGSGAGALQQFTSDKRILYAAIDRVRWNPHGRSGINLFAVADPALAGASNVGSQMEALTGVPDIGITEDSLQHQRNAVMDLTGSKRLDNQYNQEIFS